MSQILSATSNLVEWNFGDADEEATAFSSGNASRIAKVAKKVQSQRLLLVNFKEVAGNAQFMSTSFLFPFLGHVSIIKAANGFEICKCFGLTFYMNPVPAPSPTSPVVIPAWLVGTTNKAGVATMMEKKHPMQCVTQQDLLFWYFLFSDFYV